MEYARKHGAADMSAKSIGGPCGIGSWTRRGNTSPGEGGAGFEEAGGWWVLQEREADDFRGALLESLVAAILVHVRCGVAGIDGVDRDAVRFQFDGQLHGEHTHRGL
jgi:hypothetical protein